MKELHEEIVDRYMQLKDPEQFEEQRLYGIDAMKELMAGKSMEEWMKIHRERLRQYYSQFDLSILKALGWTLDEALDVRQQQFARQKGGKTARANKSDARDIALRSFIESEKLDHSFTESVDRALNEICDSGGEVPDRKTVNSWLNALIEHPIRLTSITKAKRGRPRKKE